MENPNRNGTGHRATNNGNTAETEVVHDHSGPGGGAPVLPAYLHNHGPIAAPTIVVRRDVAFGFIGVCVGVGLGIWFCNSFGVSNRRRD